MSLELIIQPFANQGDKEAPPQSSAGGFVNFNLGYTRDYEINLKSGNPQAKAVERPVQNYLFNQLTEAALAWQRRALPPWFAGMSDAAIGGYPKDAQVIRQQADGSWKPYRSLVAANITDPLTSPGSWEYVRTYSEIAAVTPMPSGAGTPSVEVIKTSIDLNALTNSGTYEFQSEVAFGLCSNTPNLDPQVSGLLEVKTWLDQYDSPRTLQRASLSNGRVAVRSSVNGIWNAWAYSAVNQDVRNDRFKWCSATAAAGNVNAITLAATPSVTARTDGLRLRFRAPETNTGSVTINDGLGAKIVYGMGIAALTAANVLKAHLCEVEWNSTLQDGSGGTGAWVLILAEGAATQLPPASYLVASPLKFESTKKAASTEFVKGMIGNLSNAIPLNANVTLDADAYGKMYFSVSDRILTLPANDATSIGGTITIATTGATVTVRSQGANRMFVGDLAVGVSEFAVKPYSTVVLVNFDTSNWLAASGSAVMDYSSLIAAKAPLESPAFSGTPIAPTIANRFDTSNKIVNSTFLRNNLGNFADTAYVSGDVTLDASWCGRFVVMVNGSVGQNVVLPKANTVVAGSCITIHNPGNAEKAVVAQSGDVISPNGSNLGSVIVPFGDTISFVRDAATTVWRAVGSGALKYSAQFASAAIGVNGWFKHPSGIIVQYGSSATFDGTVRVNFPVGFAVATSSVQLVDSNASGWSPSNLTVFGAASSDRFGFTARSCNWNGAQFTQQGTAGNFTWIAIGI